jgi:hypothetical protein
MNTLLTLLAVLCGMLVVLVSATPVPGSPKHMALKIVVVGVSVLSLSIAALIYWVYP